MQPKKTIAVILIIVSLYFNVQAQWGVTGNAGTNPAVNYLGTADNVDFKIKTYNTTRMTINKSGIINIGPVTSSLAYFTTSGSGNTTSVFGTGASGVSLQQSYPGISFNSYYNAGFKALAAGYGGNFTLDPTSGTLMYRALGNGASAGSTQSYYTPFIITHSGTVGINNVNPPVDVDLQVGTSTGAKIQIGDQSQLIDMGNMLLDVSSTFRPTADNAYHLGGFQNRWVDVWSADGSINTSDRRDKTNIRDVQYGLKEVLKLHPVIFNWKDAPERGDKIGLIAQELQAVIKEAVVTKTFTTDLTGKKIVTENDRLGVFYSDLTPVIIKAIQEQQQEITSKDIKIQELETQLKALNDRLIRLEQKMNSIKPTTDIILSEALLYQNAPNPFSDKSVIRFYVPEKANNAELKIFSADGKAISSYKATIKGENKVEIAGGRLPAGIYNYTLVIDGKATASRQMVLLQ